METATFVSIILIFCNGKRALYHKTTLFPFTPPADDSPIIYYALQKEQILAFAVLCKSRVPNKHLENRR